MSIPILTFFNNKGGVGKTSLVYHLSWMFAEFGEQVLALDLDPQANLTAGFLDDNLLEALWENEFGVKTIYHAIRPLSGVGDLIQPDYLNMTENLHFVPGDVALAGFEELLSAEWPNSMSDTNLYRPFRILSAFWTIAQDVAKRCDATIILVDVGPNLGAINRSALIASDYVAIPLAADLFSLQGLKNLGPTLRSWRSLWEKRRKNWSSPEFALPSGKMEPLGYLIQQHGIRLSRPVKAFDRWINRIPGVYRSAVLDDDTLAPALADDPHCLAMIRHYRSLIPLAQEARKPIFALTPQDGAIGAHAAAVSDAYRDYRELAVRLRKMIHSRQEKSLL